MTSTVGTERDSTSDSSGLILKTDSRGHVYTPIARREALLAEFDRSGLSGKQFARLSGVNYSTFQYWRQCRKREPSVSKPVPSAPGQQVAWVEAVVQQGLASGGCGLILQLPGGVRAELSSQQQIQLAAALVRALEKSC